MKITITNSENKESDLVVFFGQLLEADKIQITDDPEFIDIYLSDGGVIRGINKELIESGGLQMLPYIPSKPPKRKPRSNENLSGNLPINLG